MKLEELGLRIGDAVHLQIGGETGQRHVVKLIGMLPGFSLVLTAPRRDNAIVFMREGGIVTVKLAASGTVCGFSAQILTIRTAPYPYLHLTYPADVEAMEVRKSARVSTQLPVTVSNLDRESRAQTAVLADLSAGGARMQANKSLGAVGDTLSLTLRLTVGGREHLVSMNAAVCSEVVTSHAETGETSLSYGLRFTDIDDVDALVVHGYVYERMLANMNMV